MKFNGLTNKGREYLAKVQANQSAITFKKIVIGDGRLDEHDNPAELTRLINKKAEKGIISKEQNADIVTLLTYVDNVSLSQGYYPREIGIYIDDGGEEKLYYYMNDGDETSWIPPESYGPFKIELKLNIIASNADSIVVNNPAKSMYVTKEYVDTELAEKENAFEKNSGFNKEKTSEYKKGKDAEKLFTQEGANSLYKEVETKVSKTGDRMTGKLIFDGSSNSGIEYKNTPSTSRARGQFYYNNSDTIDFGVGVYSSNSINEYLFMGYGNSPWNNGIKIYQNGNGVYPANNLKSSKKELVGAFNDLVDNLWKYNPKDLSASVGIDLDDYTQSGLYKCIMSSADVANKPVGTSSAFFLMVYELQNDSNFIRQVYYDGVSDTSYQRAKTYGGWKEWQKMATNYDISSIWGDNFGGYIQDNTTKRVGWRYIDKVDGASYKCIKVGSNVNTTEYYELCTISRNSININYLKTYTTLAMPNITFSASKRQATIYLNDDIENYMFLSFFYGDGTEKGHDSNSTIIDARQLIKYKVIQLVVQDSNVNTVQYSTETIYMRLVNTKTIEVLDYAYREPTSSCILFEINGLIKIK